MSLRSHLPATGVGDARAAFAWTAYDPVEGRLDSDDPLGLAAAAQRLADRLLPGLTVRTVSLHYYAMVCAGLALIEQRAPDLSDRERRECFIVWEKLWALARVEAGKDGGLLGVRGASRHRHSKHRERLDGRFVLLQRQPFLGALGSYTTSLEQLNLKAPGALRLTESGEELADLVWRTAAPNAWRKLQRSVWDSIRSKRDRLRHGTYGASYWRFADVGLIDTRIRTFLRDRLFDRTSARGRAVRLVLPAIRDSDQPDLDALRRLSGSQSEPDLQVSARLALALEELATTAHFALDRILGVAAASGVTVAVSAVPKQEPRWPEIEQRLQEAARRAGAALEAADGFSAEYRTAITFADLSGRTLVAELVRHHVEVMADRRARRWAALEGDRVVAMRLTPVPEEPASIRHTYRFQAARTLAAQAGIR